MSRNRIVTVALTLAALVLMACDDDQMAPVFEKTKADFNRESIPRYAREAGPALLAQLNGFVLASPCIESPAGGMGYHYLMESRVDEVVEGAAPELLLYEPTPGGGMELVGVEYMVMAPAWDAVNDGPPTLVGNAFADHRAEEDRHGIPFPHYDLHFWSWKENPSGAFAPFNPAVSCEHA